MHTEVKKGPPSPTNSKPGGGTKNKKNVATDDDREFVSRAEFNKLEEKFNKLLVKLELATL